MPWFCYATASKKRSSKSKKSKRKGGRKEIERCQTFVVIVKDYVAATAHEVSVHRGQVVEMVCTKGNWVYIRGNNSLTGYVPKDYTLEVNKSDGSLTNINLPNSIESATFSENSNIAGPAPSARSINVGTLQHSGSSVTSVEVHQVNNTVVTEFRDSGEGQAAPLAQTTPSGSSQAIYEVPRCPDGAAARTVKSDENGMAPALPPRATGLPTAAEIQQSLSSHRPTSYRCPPQRHRPGNLTFSSSANQPCPQHRLRYPYGPFPPAADGSTPRCTCHISSTNPGSYASTAYMPTAPGRLPATPYTPNSISGIPERPPSTPGCSPPVWTPPSTGRRLFGSNSPLSQRHMVRPQTATTPGVPHTPGSAGLPSATPASPVVSNFASTPRTPDCSRGDMVESLPTMGNGIRISSSSSSSYSSYGRRAMARPQRSRRYSSDLQVHSTISENIIDSSMRPDTTSSSHKQYPRRRSQPCLVTNSVFSPPGVESSESGPFLQKRPTLLPVRRSSSMHEHYANHRPLGGRNSYPCTPQQHSQQHQGGANGQMQHAVSCMEAVQTGGDERILGATPTKTLVKTAEVVTTPKRTCPVGAPSARRRSRSSSNRLDSVPSIDEEPTATTHDDVFLPETRKKPVGIFRCIKTYTPKFKGEVMMQENEMVIVLDYGMAEWAWVMTANNSEGLVSKSVLVKYQPNGIGTSSHNSTATPDISVLDDNDSGRGTITKKKGDGFQAQAGNMHIGMDACTQTDPVMDTALHTTPHSASVGLSTGYSTSSVPTNESSPLSTSQRAETGRARTRRKKGGRGIEEQKGGKDENMVLLQAAATAVAKHADLQSKGQSQVPQEWFNTIDSLDERERIKPYVDSRAGSRKPSSSQLLESSSAQTAQKEASCGEAETSQMNENERGKQRRQEPSQKDENDVEKQRRPEAIGKSDNENERETQRRPEISSRSARRKEARGNAAAPSNSAVSPAKAAAAAERSGPVASQVLTTKEVVRPGTLHYHDRISGMGSVNFNNKTPTQEDATPKLGRQRSRQIGLSNVLTAVKDYTPAPNSKNCIPIKEGDVLHLQTHMHYPKGWMWVWHTTKRSFGYVPKSYVAYTYDTVRRGRPRINTVEDAV